MDAVAVVVVLVTVLAVVFVFALSLRLRQREMQTIFKIGCWRRSIVKLVVAEIMIIVFLSVKQGYHGDGYLHDTQ